MATKKCGLKRVQIWTAVIATIFYGVCFTMGILEEGVRQVSIEEWLILAAGTFTLGAVWFIVIITPNV